MTTCCRTLATKFERDLSGAGAHIEYGIRPIPNGAEVREEDAIYLGSGIAS